MSATAKNQLQDLNNGYVGVCPERSRRDAVGNLIQKTDRKNQTVTYAYDNDNRLTQISQGGANVSFGFDSDSRRTSLALPNGVTMNYGYDAASQLTGITYMLGTSTLGNLTYAYDLAGRRIGVGGSFARANVPQAVSSATYNVNNQLTQWKGANLTYDANGNLTSDRSFVFWIFLPEGGDTWNARNQLVAISGAVSASFQYDPFGRRVSKTLGGTTQYLYDGANPVQELSGSSASANLLTGGVDEYFQRTDSAGARNFLTDALGSTLALADSAGALQTQYTFEPFGNTTVTGATTTNTFVFTGRELDSSGLYFFRARYYSPVLGRFISEDPAGLLFDPNPYRYAYDSPTNYVDPSGLAPIDYILPDWLASHINWNYVPAVCNADSFRFYGGGGGSENIQGGAYQLDDVHYANNAGNWQVDGTESDMLYEAFGEHWGGGAVMHGRKSREALLFPPSPYHAKRTLSLGPVKLRAEGGLGPLIGRSNDGISIGFYGDVGLGGGIGNYGGGGAIGGGWSVTFSSAASCVAQ